MATFGSPCSFGIPFSLFGRDVRQYSLADLNSETKTFLWHQFMIDVLMKIPRSSTAIEDILEACEMVKRSDADDAAPLTAKDKDDFRSSYTPDTAIGWYTRPGFLFGLFNKACRMVNTSTMIPFHAMIQDIHHRLNTLHIQQGNTDTPVLTKTFYRGQAEWGVDEVAKILASEGCLLSMNTILSTTTNYQVACSYVSGANKATNILFAITVNDEEDVVGRQVFASISGVSRIQDECEVLFGMSAVFRVVSVEQADDFWYVSLELTSCDGDEDVQRFMNEVKNYANQDSDRRLPMMELKQLLTTTSLGHVKPWAELANYVLTDVAQLFVIRAWERDGELKKLIDREPILKSIAMETRGAEMSRPTETFIGQLLDLLYSFLRAGNEPTILEDW